MFLAVINLCNQFLLSVLHIAFFIYLKLRLLKPLFNKIIYNINIHFRDFETKYHAENVLIEKTVKLYPKIPKHFVLALGEEQIYYEDIIQIILWCLPTGIPVLSFYDHKSELNADLLYKLFFKNHRSLLPYIKWGVSFCDKRTVDDSMTNGFTPKKTLLQINVLTSKHGRQLLIDCIKELSLDPNLNLENTKSTETAIDTIMLSKLESSPDPDLLVICGDCFTTYGLSPWHIGFTEFLLIPSYRLLTPYDFIKILKAYAYCEQNFGT